MMACAAGSRDIVYFTFGDAVSSNSKNGNDMANSLWKSLKMLADHMISLVSRVFSDLLGLTEKK